MTKFNESSKSCDAILTNVKDMNIQAENCFLCHKSDHISKKCLNQLIKINVLSEEEYDYSDFESNANSKN